MIAIASLGHYSLIAQQQRGNVPGIVLVKFERGQLARLSEQLDTTDVLPVQLRRVLNEYGYRQGRKIYERNAQI